MTLPTNDTPIFVIRGGCWFYAHAVGLRVICRSLTAPSNRHYSVGFRTTLTGRTPR